MVFVVTLVYYGECDTTTRVIGVHASRQGAWRNGMKKEFEGNMSLQYPIDDDHTAFNRDYYAWMKWSCSND
jgi:hypothetical protein